MISSKEIKEAYNKRARIYDKVLEKTRYHATLKSIIRKIKLEIPFDAKILDIGCGTGLATEVIWEKYPKSEITGLDYSENMLDLYKKRFPKLDIVIGDFNKADNFSFFNSRKKFEFLDREFDLIMSTGAISEYGEINKVIQFVYNLLKYNGVFINIGIKKNVMGLITGRLWYYKPTGKKKFISVCNSAGFSEIHNIKISWRHFPTNITKFAIMARK